MQPAHTVAVVFFKTVAPVEPVSLVKKICEDAMSEPLRKRTRFVKRLSPMTLMARATEEGLGKVTREVLAPRFHQEPFRPQKASHPRGIVQRRACVHDPWRSWTMHWLLSSSCMASGLTSGAP